MGFGFVESLLVAVVVWLIALASVLIGIKCDSEPNDQ